MSLSILHSTRSCIWLWVGILTLLVAMLAEASHCHDVSSLESDGVQSCLLCQQGFDNLKLYIHSHGLIVPVAAPATTVFYNTSAVITVSLLSVAIRAPPSIH